MEKIILIKYGELTTKKSNRNLFINKVYENMLALLNGYNVNIVKNHESGYTMNDNTIYLLERLKNCIKNKYI